VLLLRFRFGILLLCPFAYTPKQKKAVADAEIAKAAAAEKAEIDHRNAIELAAKKKLEEEEASLLQVQGQIVQGVMLLEEPDYAGALNVFQQAVTAAEALGNVHLQAKAMAGLAGAYRHIPEKKRHSGQAYEVAASLYAMVGETSDRIDCLSEASESHKLVGQTDLAIKCLEKYDLMAAATGGKAVFTNRLIELRKAPTSAKKKGLLW